MTPKSSSDALEVMLMRWASHMREGGVGKELWYPSITVEGKMATGEPIGGTPSGPRPMPVDEVAEYVEGIVCALRPPRSTIIRYRYIGEDSGEGYRRLRIREITRKLGISRRQVERHLDNAMGALEGAILIS